MSSTFTDHAGRTWTVAINVAAVKRTRELIGVDLPALVDDGLAGLVKLFDDVAGLVDALYCVCQPEADAAGITDEDFGRAMMDPEGDIIISAAQALTHGLAEYLPDAQVRAAIRKAIECGELTMTANAGA